jgi:hypothetical protein
MISPPPADDELVPPLTAQQLGLCGPLSDDPGVGPDAARHTPPADDQAARAWIRSHDERITALSDECNALRVAVQQFREDASRHEIEVDDLAARVVALSGLLRGMARRASERRRNWMRAIAASAETIRERDALRFDLSQADHFGRGEFRVTSWAYEQALRGMRENETRVAAARALADDLDRDADKIEATGRADSLAIAGWTSYRKIAARIRAAVRPAEAVSESPIHGDTVSESNRLAVGPAEAPEVVRQDGTESTRTTSGEQRHDIYVRIINNNNAVARTVSITDEVNVDFDAAGQPVGVEVLGIPYRGVMVDGLWAAPVQGVEYVDPDCIECGGDGGPCCEHPDLIGSASPEAQAAWLAGPAEAAEPARSPIEVAERAMFARRDAARQAATGVHDLDDVLRETGIDPAKVPSAPGYQRIADAIHAACEAADIDLTVVHDGRVLDYVPGVVWLATVLDKAGLIDWTVFQDEGGGTTTPDPSAPTETEMARVVAAHALCDSAARDVVRALDNAAAPSSASVTAAIERLRAALAGSATPPAAPALIGTWADEAFVHHQDHKHPVEGCGFCPSEEDR